MFGKIAKELPVYRFNKGFTPIGVHKRAKDTRTQEQILATINEILDKSPELKSFKNEIKKISPEHWGLTSDILELSRQQELLPVVININKVDSKTGKSIVSNLLEELPKASKENPRALEFAREVINNTDNTTSKYFLAELLDAIRNPKLSEHFKAAKPMVKDIAEQTLSGGYTMDFSKQKNFMNLVKELVNPENNAEMTKLLPKLTKTVDELPGNHDLYIDKFIRNTKVSTQQVEDNIQTLKDIIPIVNKQGKKIDIVDFVTHNVNLK